MKRVNGWFFVIGAMLCCATVRAQGGYTLVDDNTQSNVVFTNSLGTAALDGTMIVFEGRLDSDIQVNSAQGTTNNYDLAALRLLTQIKLFDELPVSNEVGAAQGAIAVLRDATPPDATDGKIYAWGDDPSDSPDKGMTWVLLRKKADNEPFTLADGSTNYITFVFNYTHDRYQVFVGGPEPVDQVASAAVSSPVMDGKTGINGVSLMGVGGLSGVASAAGNVAPLSSSIGFSVYATAKGILFILDPVDEQGSGTPFIVEAKINDVWVKVGEVESNGSGHYEFLANPPGLLQVGQSYAFRVIDEISNPHELVDLVTIKTIKMESVVMEPGVMVVTFNTEVERSYQVISAESLNASVWTPTAIYYPTANSWGYGSGSFTAKDNSTTVRIPRSTDKSKAFFKIRKVD